MIQMDRTYLLKQNDALFNATLDEFSSKSYDLASTNVIIKESNYNKGSFYYRFSAKEDVYFALIDYVYTISLSLLNKEKINLAAINSPAKLIEILYKNTKQLFEIDQRYFNLLKRIYHEDEYLKQRIIENCVDSSKTRIFDRLNRIISDSKLLLTCIEAVLFTYFKSFDNLDSNLLMILPFLIKDYEPVEEKKINLLDLDTNLSFVLNDFYGFDKSLYDQYRISNQIENKEYLQTIKNHLNIEEVTIHNIIKSIPNNYYIDLEIYDFDNLEYSSLTYYQKIILLLIYNSVTNKQMILIDNLLSELKPEISDKLINHILPKLAKTSKIVVLETNLSIRLNNNYKTYLLTELSLEESDLTEMFYRDWE